MRTKFCTRYYRLKKIVDIISNSQSYSMLHFTLPIKLLHLAQASHAKIYLNTTHSDTSVGKQHPGKHCLHLSIYDKNELKLGSFSSSGLKLWAALSMTYLFHFWCYHLCLQITSCANYNNFLSSTRISFLICYFLEKSHLLGNNCWPFNLSTKDNGNSK